jgi:ribA/ribD-fused uncharacterized protein
MAIKFYTTKTKWGCFSNFSRHAFSLDGKDWKTSEHYYQAQKFITTDPDYAEKIRKASSPKEAAQLGRANKEKLRPDWEPIKDDIMRKVVKHKFTVHTSCRKTLFETGEEELIEDSPKDYYWGCGAAGTGKNMLGKILMEVRAELRKRYLDW